MARKEQAYEDRRRDIAQATLVHGPAHVSRTFVRVSQGKAKYNRDKLLHPEAHPGTVGGARNTNYDDAQTAVAEWCLWVEIVINCERNWVQLARDLRKLGFTKIDRKWVSRVLQAWRFSVRNIKWRSPRKYTAYNITRYVGYLHAVHLIDPSRLKYCDEVHFVARGKSSGMIVYTRSDPHSLFLWAIQNCAAKRELALVGLPWRLLSDALSLQTRSLLLWYASTLFFVFGLMLNDIWWFR